MISLKNPEGVILQKYRSANYQREVLVACMARGSKIIGFELYNPIKDTSESLNDLIYISFFESEVVGNDTKILNCWRK